LSWKLKKKEMQQKFEKEWELIDFEKNRLVEIFHRWSARGVR